MVSVQTFCRRIVIPNARMTTSGLVTAHGAPIKRIEEFQVVAVGPLTLGVIRMPFIPGRERTTIPTIGLRTNRNFSRSDGNLGSGGSSIHAKSE